MWCTSRASPHSTTRPTRGAGLLADEVVVHRRGEQQRRDRRQLVVRVAVAEDDHLGAVGDGLAHLGAHVLERPPQAVAALGHAEQAVDGEGLEARHVVVVVDVEELGELVVGDDRVGEHHLPAAGRARAQQVALRADRAGHRGDQLLADRVERRVGDLREQLLEVVEQQARAIGEHGDRRVGAHRADRLGAGARHRREQDLQLLGGVPEHPLVLHDRRVLRREEVACREVVEVHEPGVEPLAVGVLGGERLLDLVVADDAAEVRVDEEHATRLQAALLHDRRLVDRQHADLGGHHHEAVVGDPVAAGAEAVAVEHRADHRAVGERDRRRAVPRLHQRGVEAVEVALPVGHGLVVLPRLRDHHQHGVGERVAAQVQQLEHLVEAGGVGAAGRADREGAVEAVDEVGVEQRLASPHPVLVAHHRVDLAVVGDEPVRVGEGPRRERVGGEAAVHERQRRLRAAGRGGRGRRAPPGRDEHALVHEGAGREAREVHAVAVAPSSCSTRLRTTKHRRSRSMPESGG